MTEGAVRDDVVERAVLHGVRRVVTSMARCVGEKMSAGASERPGRCGMAGGDHGWRFWWLVVLGWVGEVVEVVAEAADRLCTKYGFF